MFPVKSGFGGVKSVPHVMHHAVTCPRNVGNRLRAAQPYSALASVLIIYASHDQLISSACRRSIVTNTFRQLSPAPVLTLQIAMRTPKHALHIRGRVCWLAALHGFSLHEHDIRAVVSASQIPMSLDCDLHKSIAAMT